MAQVNIRVSGELLDALQAHEERTGEARASVARRGLRMALDVPAPDSQGDVAELRQLVESHEGRLAALENRLDEALSGSY